jgi:hypothetical protein
MDEREPGEREKETCFADRMRYCAARKHMIYFWTLVIGRRRKVWIGLFKILFFVAVA